MADGVTLRMNDAKVRQALEQAGKQARFAAAMAATKTGQRVKVALQEEMRKVFDRPSSYTIGAVGLVRATKDNLSARIVIKENGGKGTPAWKYLGPQIHGGDRGHKRFEKALQSRGILPRNMFAVPGGAARMDGFGNMSRGQIVQILSDLGAFAENGYRANRSHRRKAEYFAIPKGQGLTPGIYRRIETGGKVIFRPVLIFIRRPRYTKRLRWYEVAAEVSAEHFEAEFAQAYTMALATAYARRP